jgi:Cu/Ag efflux protein CusF
MKFSDIAPILGVALLVSAPVYAGSPTSAPIILAADSHDHDHGAQAAAMGKGVVNSVDADAHKVNISHEAIKSLGWPAMKMDFAVAPSVDLKALQPGTQIEFMVGKNAAGMPEVQSIHAAKK